MATLQQISQGGLVGCAPTPVLQHAINRYLVNNDLMNILQFVNQGQVNNLGNFQVSYVYYEGKSEATFRALGVDYNPDNEKPLTGTDMLKFLGGAFEADIEVARAFGTNPGSVANWTEQQIGQKINSIKNGFAKYFIQGDSGKDSKQFDGLDKKITESQIVSKVIDVSDMDNKSLTIEKEINKVISKVRPGRPNAILSTSTGKSILTSLNAYRNRDTKTVNVNDREYDQYMGIPVISLTDDCFSAEDLVKGIPVIFMYIDEYEGIRVCIPNDGQVVIIMPPKFDNGKVVERGACEMACTPMFANPFAVAKCYLSEEPVM